MNRMLRVACIVAVAAAAAGCSHRQVSQGSLDEISRLAIVTRAPSAPKIALSASDVAAASGGTVQTEKELAELLGKQVTRFEVQERLRTSLMQRLPATPPWTTAMPAVEVATVLEALLVDDRSEPNYNVLGQYGADAVLELRVREYGIHQVAGRTGVYLRGEGRMVMLGGGATLWNAPIDIDEAARPSGTDLDLASLRGGGWREALISAIGLIADSAAADLSGEKR